ncbi:Nucleolar GTP-binding protein 1 [Neophaeococcomyces mojaviensis]|uniref:Nucleolar GTP-binding protein 1 n=1 Tax=Neophaeococcomyces mojaviensis TaxID=3383035 RepID=A0ACC3A493_9EURO|nr:Nucleolar GTP-binding protein 1 [Knufia sp. JES_112]
MKTTWKEIAPVPTSQEFIDIVLSRTQRRLPTQIRAGFKISRIRAFYTRKVKFTAETFTEKFQAILDGFPRLQDIHPFHKDLMNTLYDADHFRIALGTLSTAKRLIETVSRDYVRLLKYAQSLFQCKNLKKAALGRMATICKRLRDPLVYLEQVRQHLGRLPGIDPNTRTLLICGYPNVGKSSFLKSITKADVDVQPYAFTTKSLFVGHFDYKYLRFQAVDTPGILDHPLEEMNTIEMQSITAIAHLRSACLYFMDLSEQCGYSVEAQINLFNSIRPLFANKLVFIVVNKTDVTKPEDLHEDLQKQLSDLVTQNSNTELLQLSCITNEGVQNVKNTVCDRLIEERVAAKLKSGQASQPATADTPTGRLGELLARIHVARPLEGSVSETYIPEAVLNGTYKKHDKTDPDRRKLERDIEEENGGAGVYNIDLKKFYDLADPDWKHDKVPEFFNGKNVADYVDPDIEERLAALEAEEERLEAEGYYDESESMDDEEDVEIRMKADMIRDKRKLMMNEARTKKSLKNKAQIPRSKKARTLAQMENHLTKIGLDPSTTVDRARAVIRNAEAKSEARSTSAMDIDTPGARARSVSRAPKTNRLTDGVTNKSATGVTDPVQREKAERMAKLSQRKMNRMARQGEADRHETASLPKHLLAGKRGMGSARSR